MREQKEYIEDTNEIQKLSSSESTRISLEAVRMGEAGLNQHRQGIVILWMS